MNQGICNILHVSYDTIFAFYEREDQPLNVHRDRCDCIASQMLEYFSTETPRLFGMSLALSKHLIHQVERDYSFFEGIIIPSVDLLTIDELWKTINEFIADMKHARYGNTIIKISKQILIFYIFLRPVRKVLQKMASYTDSHFYANLMMLSFEALFYLKPALIWQFN